MCFRTQGLENIFNTDTVFKILYSTIYLYYMYIETHLKNVYNLYLFCRCFNVYRNVLTIILVFARTRLDYRLLLYKVHKLCKIFYNLSCILRDSMKFCTR